MNTAVYDVSEFLRGIPPFDTLPPEDIERVAQACEIEFHPAGATVLLQGAEPPAHVWVVRRGGVELVLDGAAVDQLGEGEMFGHNTMLAGEVVGAAVRAVEDTLCYRIPEGAIRPVLARPAALAFLVRSAGGSYELREGRVVAPQRIDPGSRRVQELMRTEIVVCEPSTPVREAAARMAEAGSSSVLVDLGDSLGIVTDRDLRTRVVAAAAPPDTPLAEIMTAPARTVACDSTAAEVLLQMLDRGIRHFPVLNGRRKVVGIVADTDLLAVEARSPFHLRGAIARAQTLEDLTNRGKEMRNLAADLYRAGVAPAVISQLLATVNDALTRRLIELAEAELGPPPCPYTWLALGSYARREAAPGSDIDAGLAWDGPADAEPTHGLRAWWRWSWAVSKPPVWSRTPMAPRRTARLFRRPLAEWERAVRSWQDDPDQPKAVILLSVAVDSRGVWNAALSEPRLQRCSPVRRAASRALDLQRRLAVHHRPPLGFVRGFVVDHAGAHRGTLDIKLGGLLPIVDLARAAGLQAGVGAASTAVRLDAAEAEGTLPARDVAVLRDAFELFSDLRMSHQVAQIEAGEAPDDHIAPADLAPLTRTYLKEAFRAVGRIQRHLETLASLQH